ncbi:hypothetical protein P4S72_27695 [Vibrio sp. PP-XX7]
MVAYTYFLWAFLAGTGTASTAKRNWHAFEHVIEIDLVCAHQTIPLNYPTKIFSAVYDAQKVDRFQQLLMHAHQRFSIH